MCFYAFPIPITLRSRLLKTLEDQLLVDGRVKRCSLSFHTLFLAQTVSFFLVSLTHFLRSLLITDGMTVRILIF